MLVSVALVLLLMTLFAQVFQMAGGSVSTQRGLMENDQRARSVQTVLKADLDKRTFRVVYPFALNERMDAPEVMANERRGYFAVSENDPNDRTDDVLSFTVDSRVTIDSADETLFYGQAIGLAPSSLSSAQQYRFYRSQENQPDRDDGRLDPNGAADSPAAEICYFMRGGNLYRRTLLLRQPEPSAAADEQPTFDNGSGQRRFFGVNAGAPFYPGDFVNAVGFWRDFDFSAHSSQAFDSSGPVFVYDGAVLNGVSTLNVQATVPSVTALQIPGQISYPPNRFGHGYVDLNPVLAGQPPAGGALKEYTQPGGDFLGRFTQHETSDATFQYPQQNHLDVNCPVTQDLTYDANGNLVLASDNTVIFNNSGPRRGEDLILTNVHAFDVKVFDEVLGRFVDLGHSLTAGGRIGDFHRNGRLNAGVYGGNGPVVNYVFDTWYPFDTTFPEDDDNDLTLGAIEDDNGNGVLDQKQTLDINSSGGIGNEDGNANGVLNGGEDANGNGILDHENNPPYRPQTAWPDDTSDASSGRVQLPRWQPNTAYIVGRRVFPPRLQTSAPFIPPYYTQPGDPFYYVCVEALDGDSDGDVESGAVAPNFIRIDGLNFFEIGPGGDRLTWQAVDNRKPLRAIQIELRFVDPTTAQMRTLTIQHGLVD
jgi:hypothetical protein